mmetsp:Transcript_117650/g.332845  ORF Transcript_117650/g.332845 Transcript_117650/m.332845 type:complete len:232 (+) Transcript_117650:181-876(+)
MRPHADVGALLKLVLCRCLTAVLFKVVLPNWYGADDLYATRGFATSRILAISRGLAASRAVASPCGLASPCRISAPRSIVPSRSLTTLRGRAGARGAYGHDCCEGAAAIVGVRCRHHGDDRAVALGASAASVDSAETFVACNLFGPWRGHNIGSAATWGQEGTRVHRVCAPGISLKQRVHRWRPLKGAPNRADVLLDRHPVVPELLYGRGGRLVLKLHLNVRNCAKPELPL